MTDPASELHAEILGFIDDVNRGDVPAALARLTDDVCIVEDLAPFRWTGPEAGGRWLTDMAGNGARLGVTAIALTPGAPRRTELEGEHGYCILPGRVTLDGPEVALAEDGLLTFAMRREGGAWRISAFTWTGEAAKPA